MTIVSLNLEKILTSIILQRFLNQDNQILNKKMGNGGGCMATQHNDMGAVRSGGIGGGSDIDSAVLAATNFSGGGLAQKL